MNRVLAAIFLLINTSLFAQSNCERNLQEAKSDYNSGNLYAIPGKLTDCLEDGFSKDEKVEAYKLLTLTYLNINQNEKAKESLIKLLNIKTDFRALPNIDPPELYSLYRKIDTDPKYFIGIMFGGNYNTIQIIEPFTKGSVRDGNIVNYSGLGSIEAGAQFIKPLLNNFWVKAELLFQNQRYDYNEEVLIYADSINNKYSYQSTNNGLNLNISARSVINNYYWKPFVDYGISGRYNFSQSFNDYLSDHSPSADEDARGEIDMINYRKQFNIGLHIHIGTMIKLGENYGEVKIGASKFLRAHATYNSKEDRIINTIGKQGEMMDNDYNNLIYQISISFNMPFFNFK